MPQSPSRKSGYLPSLDGWRAIAILGVLMVHDEAWRIGPFSDERFRGYGSYGVALFFAISGILICTRILEEEELSGAFHLRRFYIRRLLRIQPAALVYLGVIALLVLTGVLQEYWRFWFGALFLYVNFLYHDTVASNTYGAFTGHFWTLAVEEHFYLLISLLLFFVRRHRIAVLFALLVLIKLGQMAAPHAPPDMLRRTYWQIHILLLPCLAALLLRVPRVRAAAVRWLHPGAVLLLSAIAFSLCHGLLFAGVVRGRLAEAETHVILYGFTVWIVATMLHPRSVVTRLLETAPMRYLGRLSYSVYLWHVLFFAGTLSYITFPPLIFLGGRPWKYIATLLVANVSYFWIEKPLIRLGHRLAPPATAGHADLGAPATPAA